MQQNILFIGGAGFIGSVLTPKLLKQGHSVTVVDLMIFGNHLTNHDNLTVIQGDLNDHQLIENLLQNNYSTVINFAIVCDDTGDQNLEKIRYTTNLDGCYHLANKAKAAGVNKFIYASSTSVYGNVKTDTAIDETYPPAPISDYGKFKYACENYLLPMSDETFAVCCVRPSTVFGCSPRARFDLLINNFVMTAFVDGKIKLAGHNYIRPNIHIEDITDFYVQLVETDPHIISRHVFNVTDNNLTLLEFAEIVKNAYFRSVIIETCETSDHRSYNVSSQKVQKMLGFKAKHQIRDAVSHLVKELESGIHLSPMTNIVYYNKYNPGYVV